MSKIAIFVLKKEKKISTVFFSLVFGHQNPGSGSVSGFCESESTALFVMRYSVQCCGSKSGRIGIILCLYPFLLEVKTNKTFFQENYDTYDAEEKDKTMKTGTVRN